MQIITKLIRPFSLIGLFWQNKINGQIFRWNIFFIVLSLIAIIVKFNNLPPLIPLYYSLPWGANQLVPTSYIFLPPIISIAVLIVNNGLAVIFTKSIYLLSILLIITSLIFSAFSTLSLFQIINLIS
jgi:hypothetical protein